MSRKQKKVFIRIIAAAVLLVACCLVPAEGIVRLILFLLPYAVIGYDVLYSAIRKILRGQLFDEEFLMALATLGAFAIDEYPEAVAVMLFYQLGELFQGIAVGKSRRSIAALMDISPETAVVLRDGAETEVSPEEVRIGETICVRPGEKIPLDGVILEGTTTVNTAALTGESMPQDKTAGERVISGTVNMSGYIRVQTESVYEDSTVAKILEMVENASSKKSKMENFITRFSHFYTPCVVTAALLLAVMPPLLFGGEWSEWINRALIFLVVSCPCALVISVPLSFFGGIGGASRKGILVKGASYLEQLSKVRTVVYDKTGTLTKGSFTVTAVHPEQVAAYELLEFVAAVEARSTHPVAESIVAYCHRHKNCSKEACLHESEKCIYGEADSCCAEACHKEELHLSAQPGEVREIPGKGLSAEINGEVYYVGNAALMALAGAKWHECIHPGTIVHVAKGGEYLGHIVIADTIKEDSAEAVSRLRRLGIKKQIMLTGDGKSAGDAVGRELGLDEVHTELLPADKVRIVEENLSASARLAFVGDGINDAPVLTRADIGIAMGALGSDAAIEAADIVLLDDKPTKIADAVLLSRKTMRIVWQNIVFALGVKGVVLLLGALGLTNMWAAVFADVGVMLIAILNAMRALR